MIEQYFKQAWGQLDSFNRDHPLGKWLIWVFAFLIILSLFLGLFRVVIEQIARLRESWLKAGFPTTLSPEKRAAIRRRQQFCGVLASDIHTLAKAENWNDQYFTDLEAEVEADGDYYASRFDQWIRRRSRGLRRARSLMKAIENSLEERLLVVGEPGSGKSVALRHLAIQLAEQGRRSSDPEAKVPLYINLKELPAAPEGSPTVDFIKSFVIDNVRRGDADTADFLRAHWDAYRDSGIWLFLFDSFDEIPAVLHAPTDSPIIRQHAEAIGQFLSGMGNCRGILASREYKGPNALPWQKIRILPLSQERQEQLIRNSILSAEQRQIVHRHLAQNNTKIQDNPLFLTLLCRFIKDESRPPINDHDLLWLHINRLANREPEYLFRKYNLTPNQLLKGAQILALHFGEDTSLSLAPTRDEIAKALGSDIITDAPTEPDTMIPQNIGLPSARRKLDVEALQSFLEGLVPSDFVRIIERIPESTNHLSESATPYERVAALVRYMRSSGGSGIEHLAEVVERVFPDRATIRRTEMSDDNANSANTVGISLNDLLAALVDVKIGRSDVKESRSGDQRFTFSHRRYQETLFVRYLAEHPGHITPEELLTNARWREYAVTLLQTESKESIESLLQTAIPILNQYAAIQQPTPILECYGSGVGYFEWNSGLTTLLSLLRDGLRRRRQDTPHLIRQAIADVLTPRWDTGDYLDRIFVTDVTQREVGKMA